VFNGTEKDWEALLAGRPLYQQKVLKHDDSSLTPQETGPFIEWTETEDFRVAYTASWLLLKQSPAKLRALRKREQRKMRELSRLVTDMALPKIPAGRPPDSKAQEYFEQYSGDSSYTDIAKQELQQDLQSVPDAEAKALLIGKESERIRASVRRSRRRQDK
jgi:hypothetical protein